jgi:hypothetical protein
MPDNHSIPPVPQDPKEQVAMLDVHPAHHAAHNLRDFFVHIATIVLGLCIAVGLEQIVEYLHHRHQVAAARDALRVEREENRGAFAVNYTYFRLQTAALQNDLRVFTFLQQHPGTPEEKLPGVPSWSAGYDIQADSAWKNAQQNNVVALMPQSEAEQYAQLYKLVEETAALAGNSAAATTRASRYGFVDPNPSHMSSIQVAEEINLITEALGSNYVWGLFMNNFHASFPDFAPAPTRDELRLLIGHVRSEADRKKIAAAQALTEKDLAPLRAAQLAAIQLESAKSADRH